MMGFYRLYEKYTLDQLIVNISTVCIGLEIINCLLWVIHAILEILLRVVPFLNVKSDSDAMVGYISFPFSLASGILVIFFWIELTSKKLYRKSFLDKSFWPAVIFIAIAFILLSISAILFLTDIDHKIIKNLTLAILVFILIISCTYFYAAYRTYNYSKKKETKNQSLFKEMSIKIIISGIVMIFIVFLSFSVSVISSTAGRIIFGYLTFILILVRSYLLIDIFSSRKSKNNSSRTNTDANSSNANVNSTE
jgi:protein-S-isoprenylcysteine O-methyltransferase Ste14